MSRRLAPWLPPLALIVLAAACFARLVIEPGALLVDGSRPSIDTSERAGRPIGNDRTRFGLPRSIQIGREFARLGRVPAWDEFGFGGRPRVGNPQAGLWYPPAWIARRFRHPAILGWLTIAQLLWGGFGTLVLARTCGLGRSGSLVAAGCFQASPYLLAQVFEGHDPHVWAASWYPWAFAAAIRFRRGERLGTFALPPILALALLTGHPQEGFLLALTLGVWALVDAVRLVRGFGIRAAATRSVHWSVLFLLAFGLTAMEWAPDRLTSRWTPIRGALSMKQAGAYHIEPVNLLQLLSPRALGGPADFAGHDNYWETQLGIGWTALLLVGIALARSPRRGQVVGWSTLTAAAVVFATGRRLGLFALCYLIVPGIDRFRVPARSLFLAALGTSMLAGLGVEAAGRIGDWRGPWRRYRTIVLIVLGVLLAGQIAGRAGVGCPSNSEAARRLREHERWTIGLARLAAEPIFAIALLGTTGATVLAIRRPGPWMGRFLGGLALVELAAYGYVLLITSPPDPFLGPDPIATTIADHRPAGPFRIRARDAFYPDLPAAAHGLEKANINDSFQIAHAADLSERLYPLFGAACQGPLEPGLIQGVLDRMGVAFLVTDRPEPGAPWPTIAAGANVPGVIYRNPTAMPRAYVVPRAHPAPDDASALALFESINPRDAVLLPSDPLDPDGPRQLFTPASYDANDPDQLTIRVETEAPGLLVVADTWMPGWSAKVDGRVAPILRGNHAQRVIPLPRAGRHEIVLIFRPPGLPTGLAISAASALIWIAIWGYARSSHRRSTKDHGSPEADQREPTWMLPFRFQGDR